MEDIWIVSGFHRRFSLVSLAVCKTPSGKALSSLTMRIIALSWLQHRGFLDWKIMWVGGKNNNQKNSNSNTCVNVISIGQVSCMIYADWACRRRRHFARNSDILLTFKNCLWFQFSVFLGIIFFLELTAGVLAFVFKDWIKDQLNFFINNNIRAYRDDIDLQNLIDFTQEYVREI